MLNVGERISNYRKNANMTQEEFAARLGVTPQAVSRWERGNSLPDLALMAGICGVLKVPSDVLLGICVSPITENDDQSMEKVIKQSLIAEPLRVEFGYGLVPCIQEGLKTDYLNQCRKNLAAEAGMLLPVLRLMDSGEMQENEVCIFSYDKVLAKKDYSTPHGQTYRQIIDDVTENCREHYDEIINKQIVKCLLDNVGQQYPGILDGLVPDKVSYYEVLLHMRNHVKKEGNLRDLIHILEELESSHRNRA